jgi:hypothetical protein
MLVVVGFSHRNEHGHSYWLCRCDCGGKAFGSTGNLKRGAIVSCGCKRENYFREHGRTGTPEHRAWLNMLERCRNERHPGYPYYGGRGIVVCSRWRDSFEAFLTDMGERPSPDLSIDRIDNDGNYEPGNCRWGTKKQQMRNRRNNCSLTYAGETLTIGEWTERLGVSHGTIRWRLKKGWSVERALTQVTHD